LNSSHSFSPLEAATKQPKKTVSPEENTKRQITVINSSKINGPANNAQSFIKQPAQLLLDKGVNIP